jgi:hypothetical protein
VERWVRYVVRAVYDDSPAAEGDLKTLEDWAQLVGTSYSTLSEICRLAGVRPLDARDFVRVLRALRSAVRHGSCPELFLNVSDRRTLRTLSIRAGVDLASPATAALLADFLRHQQFIAADGEALRSFLRYATARDIGDDAQPSG